MFWIFPSLWCKLTTAYPVNRQTNSIYIFFCVYSQLIIGSNLMIVKLIIRQTWVKLPKSVWCSSAFSIKLITNAVVSTFLERIWWNVIFYQISYLVGRTTSEFCHFYVNISCSAQYLRFVYLGKVPRTLTFVTGSRMVILKL